MCTLWSINVCVEEQPCLLTERCEKRLCGAVFYICWSGGWSSKSHSHIISSLRNSTDEHFVGMASS